MLFDEISFVFALQIHTPAGDLVLKFLFLVVIAFAKNIDRFGIRDAFELII